MNALSDTNRLLLVVSISFLSVGLFQGAIGPVIQDLASQTAATDVAVSGMMTVVVITSLSAQALTALVLKRVGHLPVMFLGMVFFLLGISGVALATSLTWLLVAAACKGVGDGATLLMGNVLAAEASKSAGPLNLVNAVFGVGAILAPAFISLAMVTVGTGIPGLWAAPAAMAAALVLLVAWRPSISIPSEDSEAIADVVQSAGTSPILRSGLIWLVSTFALLEAGIEASVGIWLPTIVSNSTALPLTTASMTLSWFWLLLTLARFVAAWASRTYSTLRILACAVCLCIVGCGLLLAATVLKSAAVAVLAVTFLAPGLGPVLPSALSILRNAYPRNAAAATGLAFGFTNLGAGLFPPLVGILTTASEVASGPGAFLTIAVLMAVVLLCISLAQHRRQKSSHHYQSGPTACLAGSDT